MSPPTVDVDREELTVFRVGDEYLFARYFEREALFADLREYYDGENYRFAVPVGEFDAVRERLREALYEPVLVEDPEPYCVVTGKYDEHADVLRESVATWERRSHRFFLLQSELAVSEALDRGARRVADTEFAVGL